MLLRHALTPPPATLPRTVRADAVGGDVAFATLHAAGHLVPLAPDVAVLPGADVTRADRLVALAPRVPPRTVVGRLSAVWVLTGHGDPRTLTVLYSPTAHRPASSANLRTHQATLADDDVEGLAHLLVTTALRTAVDVARHVPGAQAVPALEHLVRRAGLDPDALAARLEAIGPNPLEAASAAAVAGLAARLAGPPGATTALSPCAPPATP